MTVRSATGRWLGFSLIVLVSYGTAWAQSVQDPNADEQATASAEAQQEDDRRVRRLGDVIGEETQEFSMDLPSLNDLPQAPVQAQPEVTLPDPEADAALQSLLARRAFAPDDPVIAAELTALLDGVEGQAQAAIAAGNLPLAQRLVNVLAELDEDRAVIGQLAAERQRVATLNSLLQQADAALADELLLQPEQQSAWSLYQQALALDETNVRALTGQDDVRLGLQQRIDLLVEDGDFESAAALVDQAEAVGIDSAWAQPVRAAIDDAMVDEMDRMMSDTMNAIDAGEYDRAEANINTLIGMGADDGQVSRLRRSLDDALRYSGFEPGQLFQDGLGDDDAFGPVMVVVPLGSFIMGSNDDEDDRFENEGPQFRVSFERGFALARNEVSVGEFRRFIEASGYTTDAERRGSSRTYREGSGRIDEMDDVDWRNDYLGEAASDDLPVVHVSYNDAQAYVDWLARETGRAYRLPSEAEFEYALRAGTSTRYWWGDESPREPTENVTGDGDEFTDSRNWTNAFRRYTDDFWGPAPVGSLLPNPFGLHDMGGNVMEWLEDCWHDSYVRAPDDGSAWVNPGCTRRMLRGASWSSTPAMSRSAYRLSATSDSTDARVGFRVARDL